MTSIKPSEEKYSVYTGKKDNLPWFLILNEGYVLGEHKIDFPWFLKLTIFYIPAEKGLVSDKEAEILNQLEDDLTKQFELEDKIYYAGRFTHEGRRELFFYISNPKAISNVLNKIIENKSQVRDFEYVIEKDVNWRMIQEYLKIDLSKNSTDGLKEQNL